MCIKHSASLSCCFIYLLVSELKTATNMMTTNQYSILLLNMLVMSWQQMPELLVLINRITKCWQQ